MSVDTTRAPWCGAAGAVARRSHSLAQTGHSQREPEPLTHLSAGRSLTSQLGMFGETREFMQETNKKLRTAFTDEHMGQVRTLAHTRVLYLSSTERFGSQ